MKTDELELTIAKPLDDVRAALQKALQRVKAKSIETLDFDNDPLAAPTEPADIQLVASGQGLVGGAWGLQIFVVAGDADCDVLLVALGDDALTRIVKSGLRYSYSLGKSILIRNTIATYLH
ncbi:hypothetical protein [Microbacterium enclense]|uniref:hypothetical protein n=1 Tax=Microbacterium enclense TaxID=993073 RepID=UPI0034433BFE